MGKKDLYSMKVITLASPIIENEEKARTGLPAFREFLNKIHPEQIINVSIDIDIDIRFDFKKEISEPMTAVYYVYTKSKFDVPPLFNGIKVVSINMNELTYFYFYRLLPR